MGDDFNLDDVTLEQDDDLSLGDTDLSNFGEVNESIDFPHFKVASKQFIDFLRVGRIVCSAGGRDIASKAVCMKVEGQYLVLRSTDFDVYLKMKIDLLNEENVLTDTVIVQTDTLIKLMKAVPVNTIIYKNEDKYYIRLHGGDIVLETFALSDDKFEFNDPVEQVGSFPAIDILTLIRDFSYTVTAAVSPAERRILCSPTEAYASYMWAVLVAHRALADFDIKIKDMNVLRQLLANVDENVTVSSTTADVAVQRCVFRSSYFEYAFLLSESTQTSSFKEKIDKVVVNEGIFIDLLQFYKIVELASELPYSVGKVDINYVDEGLSIKIRTKKGNDAVFQLFGSVNGDVAPLANPLTIQAKLLNIVLRTFRTKPTVKLSLTKDGIGISCEDYSAAVFNEVE